jgi:uncharacterized protein YaaR (DUF327 family)
MAKVDPSENSSFFSNPLNFPPVKTETKKTRGRSSPVQKARFSSLLEEVKDGAELGPLAEFPVSEETVDVLMDEVRSAGDTLLKTPGAGEIINYKRAVRNFMHYVVENGFIVNKSEGIPRYLRPNFKGKRGTPRSQERQQHVTVQVIDKKLEDLAALILSSQKNQLKLAARLEEITGLLVDLVQ